MRGEKISSNRVGMAKKPFRWVTPSMIGLILLSVLLGAAWVQADGSNRVALVVKHENGDEIKQCIEFNEAELSGYEVLDRSGVDLNVEFNSMGSTICRIDGEGCTYPQDDCFCECQDLTGQIPCTYWSYWYREGGDWHYSGFGASNRTVGDGDVEGWVWSEGDVGSADTEPPDVDFDDICEPLPTDTPTFTPSPTHTSQPTDTPTFTPTPEPTHTPEPTDIPESKDKPVIHNFLVSQTTIAAGQTVQLSWDLSDAEVAYLRYSGQEEGVISPGSKNVSPPESTVYTLVAKNEGGETRAEVTITVDNQPLPPTSTPPLAPTAAAASVSPSTTSIPEPIISFAAASLTLPQGACTNLQWSVQQAEALFLDDNPVALQGSQEVCPAQSQTLQLRAVNAGGEKVAELTLTVIEAQVPPTGTALLEAVETLATLPPATSAAVVVSPAAEAGTPVGPRRFTVPTESGEDDSTGIWWTGAVVVALGLFVIVPLALIVTGWLVWWLRGEQR